MTAPRNRLGAPSLIMQAQMHPSSDPELTVVTTGINRPEILADTLDTLFANSDLLELDAEWVVNIDFVPSLPEAEAELERTLALCGRTSARLPVSVSSGRPAGGPAAAIQALTPRIRGRVVLFLEDDWWCHPELETGARLSLRDKIDRFDVGGYAYATLAGQRNIPSLSPGLFRATCFAEITQDLDPNQDAEVQVLRRWHRAQLDLPEAWTIDPETPRYFKDLGRAWQRSHGLRKWDRPQRLARPTTYGVHEHDASAPQQESAEVPVFLPPRAP